MGFDEQYNKQNVSTALTSAERKNANILIVESDSQLRQTIRQSLVTLAFQNISDATDHVNALQKLEDRHITHIIFEAKKTKIPAKEFLKKVFEMDESIVTIASSYNPTIDDVFDLLIMGARGYVVKPFTAGSLDDAIAMATKGEAMSDAILHAKDRNEALSSLVLSAVDRLATILRQANQFDTAKLEIPGRVMGLKRSVDIARTFSKGGPVALRDSIIDMLIKRSEEPATRLGRYRKRLEQRKERSGQKNQEEGQKQEQKEEEVIK